MYYGLKITWLKFIQGQLEQWLYSHRASGTWNAASSRADYIVHSVGSSEQILHVKEI